MLYVKFLWFQNAGGPSKRLTREKITDRVYLLFSTIKRQHTTDKQIHRGLCVLFLIAERILFYIHSECIFAILRLYIKSNDSNLSILKFPNKT